MSWMATFLLASFGAFVGCMIYSLVGVSGDCSRMEEAYRQGVQDGIAKAEARRMVGIGVALEGEEAACSGQG